MEENLPFPVVKKKSSIDRSFKTFTFPSEMHNRIRIKAIDINNETISDLHQKIVSTNIPESEFKPEKDIFRVKAKLSMAIDGVRESNWVTQKYLNDNQLSQLNHFRVRAVARDKKRSDWVYSNIRSIENEEVLFELIHDVLDIILYAGDKNLDYVVETMIEDTLSALYQDQQLSKNRMYDNELDKSSAINELNKLMSTLLNEDFKDNVMSSPEEFTQFLRSYKVMDRFVEEQEDFLALLVEAFLDDQLEKVVEKMSYEAILRNDEELQVLIQGLYELDVRGSLISSFYQTDLYDSFETMITDAVKLISEPAVYEEIVYKGNESYYNLFKMMLEEIYLPLLVLDQKSVGLETSIDDEMPLQPDGDIIEYDIWDGESELKNMILRDILKMIVSSNDPLQEMTVDLLDHILTPPMEKKLALWIDYAPVELIEYAAQIRENVQRKNIKDSNNHQYVVGSTVSESSDFDETKDRHSLRYAYQSSLNEFAHILDACKKDHLREDILSKVVDSLLMRDMKANKEHEDETLLGWKDDYTVEDTKSEFIGKALQRILFVDTLNYKSLKKDSPLFDEASPGIKYSYTNVFKPHIRDSYSSKKYDLASSNINPMPSDIYIMNEDEFIHYVLDGQPSGPTLGNFVLGTNTLRGSRQ